MDSFTDLEELNLFLIQSSQAGSEGRWVFGLLSLQKPG